MALAYLIAQSPEIRQKTVAYTVDHRVRSGSASEADNVHKVVSGMGISHRVLTLDTDPISVKELSLRQARYSKLIEAMVEDGISTVVTAHTRDDCIETFVVRMLRRSGIFGLAGIQREVAFNPFTWAGRSQAPSLGLTLPVSPWTVYRPLLAIPKPQLRDILVANSIPWFEDPTNQDVEIAERNLVRKMYYEYEDMIPDEFKSAKVLSYLEKLSAFRRRVDAEAKAVASTISRADDGGVFLTPSDVSVLSELSPDTLQLALKAIISPLSPLSDLSLRLHRMRNIGDRFEAARQFTLAGVEFAPAKGGWKLTREVPRVVQEAQITPGKCTLWDNRFFVTSDRKGTIRMVDWAKDRHLFTDKTTHKIAKDQAKKRNPIVIFDGSNEEFVFPLAQKSSIKLQLNTMPK